jgi:predicted transcriptional regulator
MNAKKNPRSKEPSLPDSELEVLRVLWDKQKATARTIWTQLRDKGSKWSYATVNTLLQRLEAKNLATSDKSKVSYVYTPKISRQQVIKRRVNHLVDKLYDGRGSMLVMHLLKSQRLSPQEVSEIRQLLTGAGNDDA